MVWIKVYGVNATWSGLPKPSDVIGLLTYIKKTKSTNRAAAKVHFCNCTRSPVADGKLHYRVTVPRSNLLTLHDLVNFQQQCGVMHKCKVNVTKYKLC